MYEKRPDNQYVQYVDPVLIFRRPQVTGFKGVHYSNDLLAQVLNILLILDL